MSDEKEKDEKNENIEYLLEKVIKIDRQDKILKTTDRILEGLKMFQSMYLYFLHIMGNKYFTLWYESHSGENFFTDCELSLGHSFSDSYSETRCSATRLVTNFFFFPHYNVENYSSSSLKKKKSFSDISDISNLDFKEELVVKRYDMSGFNLPDHTFITINTGTYLIIMQSFYYAYNINSKYGIVLLSGDEIQKFEKLMESYENLVKQKSSEIDIIDLFVTELNIERLNKEYEKYTGIDLKKHCYYTRSVNKKSRPYFETYKEVYSTSSFLENLCQKLSYVLKFLTLSTDFEKIKEDEDIFFINPYYYYSDTRGIVFNAFTEQVDFSNTIEFIKYTGILCSFLSKEIPSAEEQFGECALYDNYYTYSSLILMTFNFFFTAINYMFELFDCSGIFTKKYGDIIDSYTGDNWSKEFYKKILKLSKIIRDISEDKDNKDKNYYEISKLIEDKIKLKQIPLEDIQFVPQEPIHELAPSDPLSLPSLQPLTKPIPSLNLEEDEDEDKSYFDIPVVFQPL